MNKSTRLAVLLASTSIGTALPIAGWAGTCVADLSWGDWSIDNPDYSGDPLNPTEISTPNATTFVSGCISTDDSKDYFQFTGLNPGVNTFEVNLRVYNAEVDFGTLGDYRSFGQWGSTNTSQVEYFYTESAFIGGSYLFSFLNESWEGAGWGAYTVSLTEAPLAPVPLPATAGLLGLGLAGLGAVGRRKRAKVRG